MREGHSKLGAASVALACVPFVAVPIFIGVEMWGTSGVRAAFLPLNVVCGFAPLLGLGLGIAGIAQRTRKRTLGILGTALNTLYWVGGISLIVWIFNANMWV